jgi:tetratricopeptide (TPR) repeat protein
MSNARLEELRGRFQDNPRRYFAPFANELRKSGDSAQAIEICRTHLGSQPGHVSGHIVLAQALHEAGELTEARQVFTTALELDPENLIALRSMGELAYANGEFGDARRWYVRLLDADPRNAEVAQLVAVLADQPVDFTAETATQPPPVPSGPPPLSFAGPGEPDRSDDRAIEAEGVVEDMIDFVAAPQANAGTLPEARAVPEEPLDLDVLGTRQDTIGDPAAAPEPIELDDVREPVPPAGSLEIEDMDSFLSPPSSPIVAPETEAGNVTEAEAEFSAGAFGEDDASIRDESGHLAPGKTDEPGVETRIEADSTAPEAGFELPADWNDAAVVESDAAAAPTISSDPVYSEPEAAPEPPHALFAENGFEGSAASTDASGWRTPQAYPEESDPASSAEWMDEEPAADAPAVDASAQADAEPDDWFAMGSPTPAVAEATEAPDDDWFVSEIAGQATPSHEDDWFDEPPPEPEPLLSSAASAAELYLAPELVPVTNGREAAAVDDEVVQADPVAAAAGEPVESSAASEVSLESGAGVPVEADVTAEVTDASSAPDETVPEAMLPPAPPAMAVDLPRANLGHTPRFSAAMAPETLSTPPFVTETLAELYIKQGFHNEALAIYRQLAERDPGDDALRRRIEALEVGETASVSRQADEPDEATEEHRVKSQSVRGFFAGFARRTPSAAAVEARLARNAGESGGDVGMARPDATADPSGGQPESSFAAAASALATLFAASRPGGADEGAASKLAGAYTEPAPGGRASRAADRELSLDHLFRDVPASGTGGVMLDQFYSSPVDSSGQAARPDEGAGTPDEGEADIRQFTAWLEGLRKK